MGEVKLCPCGQRSCVHSSCYGIQMNEYGELVVEYISWKETRKTVGKKCRESYLFTTNPRWAAPLLNIRLSYGTAYWSTNQVKVRLAISKSLLHPLSLVKAECRQIVWWLLVIKAGLLKPCFLFLIYSLLSNSKQARRKISDGRHNTANIEGQRSSLMHAVEVARTTK